MHKTNKHYIKTCKMTKLYQKRIILTNRMIDEIVSTSCWKQNKTKTFYTNTTYIKNIKKSNIEQVNKYIFKKLSWKNKKLSCSAILYTWQDCQCLIRHRWQSYQQIALHRNKQIPTVRQIYLMVQSSRTDHWW